jgi:hypothetical protein
VNARRDLSGTAMAAVAPTQCGGWARSRRAPGHRMQPTPGQPWEVSRSPSSGDLSLPLAWSMGSARPWARRRLKCTRDTTATGHDGEGR